MSKAATKGQRFEARLARLLFAEGFLVRRGVDLRVHFGEEFTVTDLDIFAIRFSSDLSVETTSGECKSGTGRSAPKAIDRLLWGHGVQALVGTDKQFVAVTKPTSDRTRRLAADLGLELLDERDISHREELRGLDSESPFGSHDVSLLPLESSVPAGLSKVPELKRVHRFVASEFWLMDPVAGIKKALGACRLLARTWHADLPEPERKWLEWLASQAVLTVVTALVRLAGESYRQPEAVFERHLVERLAEGVAPYHVLEEISREADRYLMGVLRDVGASPAQQVEILGALNPRPPSYAEPLVEVVQRIAREPDVARDLPRLLDWRIGTAEVREIYPEPFDLEQARGGARLLRLVRTFLAGQTRMPAGLLGLLNGDPAVGESKDTSPYIGSSTPFESALFGPEQGSRPT